MSSLYNVSWDGTFVKRRCCWVLVGFLFFFFNYKRIPMTLLPELGGGGESSNECILSFKLLSVTISAGGPQCCHTPVLIRFCWKQKVVHASPVRQTIWVSWLSWPTFPFSSSFSTVHWLPSCLLMPASIASPSALQPLPSCCFWHKTLKRKEGKRAEVPHAEAENSAVLVGLDMLIHDSTARCAGPFRLAVCPHECTTWILDGGLGEVCIAEVCGQGLAASPCAVHVLCPWDLADPGLSVTPGKAARAAAGHIAAADAAEMTWRKCGFSKS